MKLLLVGKWCRCIHTQVKKPSIIKATDWGAQNKQGERNSMLVAILHK